jgi:hypothetical protein
MAVINNLKRTGLLAGALAPAVSSPAWSHHSHAMFDHEKELTIDGTVTEWVFRNPHVHLYVETSPWGAYLDESDRRFQRYRATSGR